MPGEPQPLFSNQPIVNADGTPTQYFIRWAQQRQVDISGGITAAQAQQLVDDFAAGRSVKTGTGLTGGGTLAADRTLKLADTAVEPGTVGDATHVAKITVDQQGRITDIEAVPITTLPDAPNDGKYYCRQNGAWVAVNVVPA